MSCAQAMGEILWLCSGPRLLAVDVSDPADPVVLGQTEVLPGVLVALALDESRRKAWVIAGQDAVGLDLADSSRPVELGRVRVERWGYRAPLALTEGRLWMQGPVQGIVVGVDVRDPRNPRVGETVDIRTQTGGAVLALAARGERLYVLARVGPTEESDEGEDLTEYQLQVFQMRTDAPPLRVQVERAPAAFRFGTGTLMWDGDLLWAKTANDALLAWRDDGRVL